MADLLKQVEQIKSDCDAIFTIPALGEQQVKQIVDIFGKPTFTAWGEGVRFGILAAVAERRGSRKTGRQHAEASHGWNAYRRYSLFHRRIRDADDQRKHAGRRWACNRHGGC